MSNGTFRALVVDQKDGYRADFRQLTLDDLPEGDVLVRVTYSTLNYKDGLAVTGKGKIIRNFPLVPGIDLVGYVEESESPDYKPGDRVVITGWGLGEDYWGGYTQVARVKSEWLVPLPDELTDIQAMGIGTAGFTAMQSVIALEQHSILPVHGEIVVTGATGGVGSIAVAVLAKLGYNVVASTGSTDQHEYLKSLGATSIIPREELDRDSRPMEKTRWAGAIDSVGGRTLATLLATMHYRGCIASVGLVGSHELHATVFPLILRGVNLLGINSVFVPREERIDIWDRLTRDLPLEMLNQMIQVEPLSRIHELSEQIISGKTTGRIVIDVTG